MVRVDLRTVTLNVPPQEVITKDNVTVRVNAVAYFRVIDPNKAITEVENFLLATSQIAQTTLRSVLGKAELDALLAERERLNLELQQIIDEQTEPWGIKVSTVEVKDVELPADMQRAIARQAEAERERRAKIIAADGEFQAAEKLSQAGDIISQNPATLQLRYLQTLLEIGVNQNSTIVFPLPIDLMKPLVDAARDAERAAAANVRRRPRRRQSPEHRPRSASTSSPACGRSSRPAGPSAPTPSTRARRSRSRTPRERCPFCEGREDRTPPEVWAEPPRRRRAGHARLAAALGAEPLPGARRRREGRREPRAPAEPGSRARSTRCGARRRGEPDLFRSQPATGAHEVIVNAPRARRPRSPS